ncbi:hypothetical protein [Streptomyces sp. SID9727]|uniref:hypothetical protein n=1 Tax=Streptomyces sp. SID9727 TaxID=2706114 RepID=UPI0013C9063E|nr:hypothetical protein [Streptomyces sp. SID9727]NEC63750.1 hypothetical protein [Streptomyces sp. SID9727]
MTTNEELLTKDTEILQAIKGVRDSIPGTGTNRLATEEYIGKQIAELKKSSTGGGSAAPAAEKKSEPGAFETLLQGLIPKEIVESVKSLATSSFSMTTVVTLGLALVGALGLKILQFDVALKTFLEKKGKKISTTKSGLLPKLESTEVTQMSAPDTEWTNRSVARIEAATKKLGTAIDGLHTKVDGLLAEFA